MPTFTQSFSPILVLMFIGTGFMYARIVRLSNYFDILPALVPSGNNA